MRYFFEIAYKGSGFHGWQRQQNANSVQQEVEVALSTMLRQTVSITGSGRTDTGVHCEQQFFHVDFKNTIDENNLKYKLNSFLTPGIAIKSIRQVKDSAHARFDAISRTYQYRIARYKNPFLTGLTYYYSKPLDLNQMNEASEILLGQQDFECFSKVKTEVNNFVCTINSAKWVENESLIVFEITANRFLRGMVRAIVGTLLLVGSNKLETGSLKNIIAGKNRREAGSAAPAEGLFLTTVKYPENIYLGLRK
ncbi:MAG: tRNA pseudouridine(38-40) synthase TruA [Bacteroidota bacterium]